MPGHPARNVAATRPVGLTVPRAKLTFGWWVGAGEFGLLTYPCVVRNPEIMNGHQLVGSRKKVSDLNFKVSKT